MRLDTYLVENGLIGSREKAKELIIGNHVFVNSKTETKPSYQVKITDSISINQQGMIPYVSRGGLKLEKAIKEFEIDFNNKTILDIGASTGGFTDCAIKHGASLVYAIDVGSNQLDETLQRSEKIKSFENCDIRTLDTSKIGIRVDIVVADLSFISLMHILAHLPKFIIEYGKCILLIKPQFEAGKENIGKGGIVKDKKIHKKVIITIAEKAESIGLYLNKITYAPIIDKKKNIEYLGLFEQIKNEIPNIENIVNRAFQVSTQSK